MEKCTARKNYMGNVQNNANNGDMTSAEYLEMMEIINHIDIGPGARVYSHKDVMITLVNLKSGKTRLTFRLYKSPAGVEINKGDRIVLYPKITDSVKRIYVVKNNNGRVTCSNDSVKSIFVMIYCDGEFAYFNKLLERGIRRIHMDWKLDRNVKIPYVDIEEGLLNADQNLK